MHNFHECPALPLSYRSITYKLKYQRSKMVPLTGLEPVRPYEQQILSLLWLPITPQRHSENLLTIQIQNYYLLIHCKILQTV